MVLPPPQKRPRTRRFTAGLASAVLVAVILVVAAQAYVSMRLITGNAATAAEQQVSADAAALQALATKQAPQASLAFLEARPDVLSAKLLDSTAVAADPLASEALQSGAAATDAAGNGLRVAAPVNLAGTQTVLELQYDPSAFTAAEEELWHEMLVLLGAGALGIVALTMVLGGRQLAGRHRDVVEESLTDDLTGLPNRRAFMRRLPQLVDRALTVGDPLALGLVDITGLATVNDEEGRRKGDSLLVTVSRILKLAGKQAEVFRLGSSGFAVVMPAVNASKAASLAERLRHRIGEEAAPLAAVFGLCMLDDRFPDSEALLVGADAALNEAHRNLGTTEPRAPHAPRPRQGGRGSKVFTGTQHAGVPERPRNQDDYAEEWLTGESRWG